MAGAAAQHRLVGEVADGEDVGETTGQPRAAAGQEAAYLCLDGALRVDTDDGGGDVAEATGEGGGEGGRVVEVAARQVVVGHLVEHRLDGAADQAAPGELVDAERDVERDGVLGARGVRGAGGQVHREARLEADVVDPSGVCTSHCLDPAVWKTKTSWLSVWTANPWEPGGVR